MRVLFAVLVALLCLIPAGCVLTAQPRCAMPGYAESCAPYATPNPMRYSEDMHPTVAPDGSLYLQPFSGLKGRINAP